MQRFIKTYFHSIDLSELYLHGGPIPVDSKLGNRNEIIHKTAKDDLHRRPPEKLLRSLELEGDCLQRDMQIFGEIGFQTTRSTRILQRQNATRSRRNTDISHEFIHAMSAQIERAVQPLEQDIRPPRPDSAMANIDSDEEENLYPIQPISSDSEEEHDREIAEFQESRAAQRNEND